jgi:hypothetical protein
MNIKDQVFMISTSVVIGPCCAIVVVVLMVRMGGVMVRMFSLVIGLKE